jgi:glycosyltransferase involved in cell wall biosynthesis
MGPLVTIGLPIYKRLHYLENVLNVIDRQDYPHIELLVSDNGVNGAKVRELVDCYYPKPYKFRQNSMTVSISTHFNQLIGEASGKYFVILADDDEITANYVSTLVDQLERHPQALVAISMQETIDESGNVITRSNETMPEILSGTEFIRAAWGTHELGHESFSTFLARTSALLNCGGYPDFWKGHANDDALLVKLSLGSHVALNTHCSYRKRFDESSHGFALAIQDLAGGLRDFLRFLDSDPIVMEYAQSHPAEWCESKRYLVDMAWKTYFYRWTGLYRGRLTAAQWVRAGFALPFIPDYYRAVRAVLIGASLSVLLGPIRKYFPAAYGFYRSAKSRYRAVRGVR